MVKGLKKRTRSVPSAVSLLGYVDKLLRHSTAQAIPTYMYLAYLLASTPCNGIVESVHERRLTDIMLNYLQLTSGAVM